MLQVKISMCREMMAAMAKGERVRKIKNDGIVVFVA